MIAFCCYANGNRNILIAVYVYVAVWGFSLRSAVQAHGERTVSMFILSELLKCSGQALETHSFCHI